MQNSKKRYIGPHHAGPMCTAALCNSFPKAAQDESQAAKKREPYSGSRQQVAEAAFAWILLEYVEQRRS
jgi:hypothetical protein